jgi:phytoene dehydrogenase-like protein
LQRPKAIVVGAGHNGLVVAFYLARAGLDVTVLEARDVVGGACVTEELIPGFKFSSCANRAAWLRPKVVEDMKIVERGVTFSLPTGSPLGAQATALANGEPFVWWPDAERTRSQIARFSARDADAWGDWQAFWGQFVELFGPFLLRTPPSLAELIERAASLGIADALQRILTTSVADLADSFFESPVVRNAVQPPHDSTSVDDVGSSLVMALAAAARSYTETGQQPPGGFVRGGMGEITRAMAAAAIEEGAEIRLEHPVEEIVVDGGRVRGVRVRGGDTVRADVVVSNTDPKRTFGTLVAAQHLDETFRRRVANLTTRVAPFKLLCALSEVPRFEGVDSETVLATGSYSICPDRAFQAKAWEDARDGELPTAPIMSVSVPSIWDDTVSPAGMHTASVFGRYVPVRLARGTWEARRREFAERLVDQITAHAPNFRDALIDYVLLTPYDLEQHHLLTDGNIHHVDLSSHQLLWQRPLPELSDYRSPIQGLYLCGAGTHPYGEVSGASGHNAAHVVLGDHPTRRVMR